MAETRAVYKWSIPVDDQWHRRPVDTPLYITCQNGPFSVEMWAENLDVTPHEFRVFGTGHPVEGEYMGTAIPLIVECTETGRVETIEQPLVWHLYRRPVIVDD
jgi:hypothetical protein